MPSVTAVADTYTIPHDLGTYVSSVALLDNDSDSNGHENLIVVAINGDPELDGTLPSGAQLGVDGYGNIDYTPVADSAYTDSFTYTVEDQVTLESATATVTIHVVNNAPVISSVTLDNDSPATNDTLTATVAATDAEDDYLTYTYVWYVNGTAVQTTADTSATNDILDLSQSGYGDAGDTIYVSVTPSDGIDDGTRVSSGSATVADTAPEASDLSYSVIHDTIANIDLSQAMTDADGDSMQSSAIISGPSNGQLVLKDDGTYDYQANAGWTGTDSFTFTVNDGTDDSNTATVTIDVTNTAPTASDATLSTERCTQLADIELTSLVSDDDGDSLTTTIVSGPSNGTLTQNADGTYIYMPDVYSGTGPYDGFFGTDSFTFQTTDGVATASATVTINVTYYAPTNGDGSYSVLHDTTLANIDFSANDTDANSDPAAITIVSGPSNGTLAVNADGTYNYTPDAAWIGTDSVTVSANGGSDVVVTIHVTDNAPVARATEVPIEAYNGFADGMDFSAGATDADGGERKGVRFRFWK